MIAVSIAGGGGAMWEAAVEAVRPLGDDDTLARVLFHLANVRGLQGRGRESLAAAEELGALGDRTGRELHRLLADDMRSQALAWAGRPQEALEHIVAFHARAPAGSFFAITSASALGDVSLELGDHAAALSGFAEALRLLAGLDHPRNIVFQLDGAARALAGQHRHEDAVVTAAIADLVRSEFVVGMPDRFLADRDADLAPARAALGPDGVRGCEARAAGMGLEQGVTWVGGLA
jgi:tetratricopeptide (TPR) repeat protein